MVDPFVYTFDASFTTATPDAVLQGCNVHTSHLQERLCLHGASATRGCPQVPYMVERAFAVESCAAWNVALDVLDVNRLVVAGSTGRRGAMDAKALLEKDALPLAVRVATFEVDASFRHCIVEESTLAHALLVHRRAL